MIFASNKALGTDASANHLYKINMILQPLEIMD